MFPFSAPCWTFCSLCLHVSRCFILLLPLFHTFPFALMVSPPPAASFHFFTAALTSGSHYTVASTRNGLKRQFETVEWKEEAEVREGQCRVSDRGSDTLSCRKAVTSGRDGDTPECATLSLAHFVSEVKPGEIETLESSGASQMSGKIRSSYEQQQVKGLLLQSFSQGGQNTFHIAVILWVESNFVHPQNGRTWIQKHSCM